MYRIGSIRLTAAKGGPLGFFGKGMQSIWLTNHNGGDRPTCQAMDLWRRIRRSSLRHILQEFKALVFGLKRDYTHSGRA